jgi:general L-amino acid transport system permease protein
MTDIAPDSGGRPAAIPFWRDGRVLGVLAQIAFFTLVVAGLIGLGRNVAGNIGRLGENQFLCRDGSSSFRCAFDFLRLDSQFAIAETVIPFDPSDSYGRALLVGALNTVKVGFFGIVLATLLGVATGIARSSAPSPAGTSTSSATRRCCCNSSSSSSASFCCCRPFARRRNRSACPSS